MNELFINYKKTREHYLSNAEKTIQLKEFRKASELLWGAITQTIKSLAVLSEIRIYKHSDFNNFLRYFAKEVNDETVYNHFLDLQSLHRNFYEEFISDTDFPIYYTKTIKFLEMIDEYIIKKLES